MGLVEETADDLEAGATTNENEFVHWRTEQFGNSCSGTQQWDLS